MSYETAWQKTEDLEKEGKLEIVVTEDRNKDELQTLAFLHAAFNSDIVNREVLHWDNRKYRLEVQDGENGPEAKIRLIEQNGNGRKKILDTALPGFYIGEKDPQEITLHRTLKRGIKYLERQLYDLGAEGPILPRSIEIAYLQEQKDNFTIDSTGMHQGFVIGLTRPTMQNRMIAKGNKEATTVPYDLCEPIEYLDKIASIVLNRQVSLGRIQRVLTGYACDLMDFFSYRNSEKEEIQYNKVLQCMETIRRMICITDLFQHYDKPNNIHETNRAKPKLYFPSKKKLFLEKEAFKEKGIFLENIHEKIWNSDIFDRLVRYTQTKPSWYDWENAMQTRMKVYFSKPGKRSKAISLEETE